MTIKIAFLYNSKRVQQRFYHNSNGTFATGTVPFIKGIERTLMEDCWAAASICNSNVQYK